MSDIRSFAPLWGEWEIEKKLGEGSYGAVWKVRRNVVGGRVYYAAVKHISIPKDESEIDQLIGEGIVSDENSAPSAITEDQLSAVISHEKTHIRHGDHLWKILGFVILSVYWWNPLVWVAYVLFCRDIELICDESVVRDMKNEDRIAYSEALLSFNMPRRIISACPLAFGESGVKARIKSVLNYKKPALWIIIIAIVASTVVAVLLLTDPPSTKPEIDPFKYDGISVWVTGKYQGYEGDYSFDEIKEGAKCTLPYFANPQNIVCTIESVNPDTKMVTISIDPPLLRADTKERCDRITMMLDHIAYEGVGHDTVTLLLPEDQSVTYTFCHTRMNGMDDELDITKNELPIEKYVNNGTIPALEDYYDDDVAARVYGFVKPNGKNYPNNNNKKAADFFETLKVPRFEETTVNSSPDGESILISFYRKLKTPDGQTPKTEDMGSFRIYEDDIVEYTYGDNSPVYFKAVRGTFDDIVTLEETKNGITPTRGTQSTITVPKPNPAQEFTIRYAREDGTIADRDYYLYYNSSALQYQIRSNEAMYFSSAIFDTVTPIITNAIDYTLTVDKTDTENPMIVADYDGKTVKYRIVIEDKVKIKLVSDNGNMDFVTHYDSSGKGLIEGFEDTQYHMSITRENVMGRFMFTVKLFTGEGEKYTHTYLPDNVYDLSVANDDDGYLQIIAKGSDGTYTIVPKIKNGAMVLDGAPKGFGSTDNEIILKDDRFDLSSFTSSASADIDGDGIKETVSIGPGMYSGLKSFSIYIEDTDGKSFPRTFVTSCIHQELVKCDDGKLRLRTEYENEVIYYDILPYSEGILKNYK